jgi:dihydrofolate reductase
MEKKLKPFSLVVATAKNGGIGLEGGFPWPFIKKDLAHFARVTKCTNLALTSSELAAQTAIYHAADIFESSTTDLQNVLIMGRKTYESLPANMQPLPDRLNFILTANKDYQPKCKDGATPPRVFPSMEAALEAASFEPNVGEIFVIGGHNLYAKSLSEFEHLCKLVIRTRINKDFKADVMMPEIPKDKFTPIFISQTYSQFQDDLTFDYCVEANRSLLKE